MTLPVPSQPIRIQDPLLWARAHPSFFFAEREPSVKALVAMLANGVAVLTGATPRVDEAGEWQVISSTVDWLSLGRFPVPSNFKFEGLTPFPELGDNNVRPEAMLAAFAEDIVSKGPEGLNVVKGAVHPGDVIYLALDSVSGVSRVVAFRRIAA